MYLGGTSIATGEPFKAGVRALDSMTGALVWEHAANRTGSAPLGGVLTNAGDVLFYSNITEFMALNARDGTELWRVKLGGAINASPMSFAIAGKQMVTIPAGNTLYVFRL